MGALHVRIAEFEVNELDEKIASWLFSWSYLRCLNRSNILSVPRTRSSTENTLTLCEIWLPQFPYWKTERTPTQWFSKESSCCYTQLSAPYHNCLSQRCSRREWMNLIVFTNALAFRTIPWCIMFQFQLVSFESVDPTINSKQDHPLSVRVRCRI